MGRDRISQKWPVSLLAGCLAGGFALLAGMGRPVASVINVATTGTDTPGRGAVAAPCATVRFTDGEALAGDTIKVAAGTYAFAASLIIQKAGLHLQGNMAGMDARTRAAGGSGETIIRPAAGSSLFGLWRVTILTSDAHSGYVVSDDIFSHNSSALRPESDGGTRSVFEQNAYIRNGSGVFTPDPFKTPCSPTASSRETAARRSA